MKKFFIYFTLIFTAIVFQSSVIPVFFSSIWIPDLMLMFILAGGLIDGFEDFLPWAILAGILYDLSSFSVVGTSVIVFVLVSYGVGFFSKRYSTEMKGGGALFAIFFVFSATLGSRLISSFDWVNEIFLNNYLFFSKNLFLAWFWNMIIFFMCFFLINKVQDFFYLKRKDKIIV